VQGIDQLAVDLQHRLAAGQHHERGAGIARNRRAHVGQFGRRRETAAAFAVDADEIGVAELAVGFGAILLAAGPQIAAGKAAEDGGATRVRTLALQRVENLLHGVHAGIPNRLHAGIQA